MKRILLVLALLFAPSVAWAQCSGVFPDGTVCGNATGGNNTPRATPSTSFPAPPLSAIDNDEILSNISGSSAVPIGNTLTAIFDAILSTSQGSVIYRNATDWVALASSAGTLTNDGSGGISWGAAGTGTVTSVTQGTGIVLTPSPITTTGSVAVDVATASNFYGATANKMLDTSVPYTAVPTPAFSATPTFDFNTSASFAPGALTANITSMTCNNLKPNQAGFIEFTQDGSGGHTTVYCSAFKFAGGVAPTLSTGAGAIDWLVYQCKTSSYCVASLIKNVS